MRLRLIFCTLSPVIWIAACSARQDRDASALPSGALATSQPAGSPPPGDLAANEIGPPAPGAAHVQPAQISPYVRKVFQDRDRNFWFGTNDDGVCRYDGRKLTFFSVPEGFGGTAVRGIVQDRGGAMWFATNNGVSRFETDQFTNYKPGPDADDCDVWSLFLDKSGTLWVGTLNGIRRFDGRAFVPFTLPRVKVEKPASRFGPEVVFDMAEDRAGNIWFGTDGEGVHKYDGKAFTSYTTAEGLAGNQVRSILVDRRGRVWVGTDGGGVSCIDGAAIRTFTKIDGLGSNRVFEMLEDRAGHIWFATLDAGVCRYDGKTFTKFGAVSGLTPSHVQNIYEATDGTLWFGCSGGLFRFDGTRFINVSREGPWPVIGVDRGARTQEMGVDAMASFSRMVGGRWKNTALAGTVMFDTWHWGPGRLSIRAMTDGTAASGDPWQSVAVYYWHPGRKAVRTLRISPAFRGVSEGTITFDGQRAEGVFDLYQTVSHRELGLRWNFDGPDKYHDELLDVVPGGFALQNEWDRFRVAAGDEGERAASSRPKEASEPSEFLRPLTKLLGHAWAGEVAMNAAVPPDRAVLRTHSAFQYVPYADAIYGRVEFVGTNGAAAHAMDIYLYHHTGARVLRCLALSSGSSGDGVVHDGDITPVDGGRMLKFALTDHRSDGAAKLEIHVEFEPNGDVRQRVWSIDGEKRGFVLDLRHSAKRE